LVETIKLLASFGVGHRHLCRTCGTRKHNLYHDV